MQYNYIEFSKKETVAFIKLSRPNKLNAICFEMVEEINHAVTNIDLNNISAIFILGSEKAFSAGGDLKEMQQLTQEEAERRSNYIHDTFRLFQKIEIPTVAFIQGFCFGGGLELALHCDIRICDNTAKFAFPEVKYGMIPGAGGTVRLPIVVGETHANYYLLTGEEFSVETAQKINLINKVVKTEKFEEEINNKLEFFKNANIDSLKAIKLLQNRTDNIDDAYKNEAQLFSKLLFKNAKEGIGDKFRN